MPQLCCTDITLLNLSKCEYRVVSLFGDFVVKPFQNNLPEANICEGRVQVTFRKINDLNASALALVQYLPTLNLNQFC